MTTMRDVARIAEVSAKTVSRVFNGDPHVLPDTRERVEKVLRDLNYVPNSLATSFRSGRAPVIGIAVPDITDPFFASIAKSIETVAMAQDMSTLVASLGTDPTREGPIVEALLKRGLSGLVIAPITSEQSYLKSWVDHTPLVFVDRAPTKLAADSFTDDDYTGAQLATSHLIDHGHRRIAFIGDRLDLPTTAGRLAGYKDALLKGGIAIDEDLIQLEASTRAGAALALDRLESFPNQVTALFSSNASCTMSLMPSRPTDRYALVGFGDFPMADSLTPPVTVIDQDPAAIGALAADRIFQRLNNPARRYKRRTVLSVTLLERSSCEVAAPI